MRQIRLNRPEIRLAPIFFAFLCLLAPKVLCAATTLGTSSALYGPAAGTDSVIVSAGGPWIAAANAPWLHTSASGAGSGLAVFSYDANPDATRTGTLTIGGQTLTVTQAGSTHVAANPVTALIGSALNQPLGIAVDDAGNVYVADSGNNRIRKWTAATQAVTTVVGTDLKGPSSIAVDSAGNLYIADPGNVAIKKWTAATQTLSTLVGTSLSGILGVAIDTDGNVYIGDAGNHVIKKWTASTQSVTTIVSSGLLGPLALAPDSSGNLYIADNLMHKVFKWTAATQVLTPLVSSGLNSPRGVAVDGAGNVYIADALNNAVKKWTASTQAVTTLLGTGLSTPRGMAVDATGNVYFSEQTGNVVKELPYAFVDPAGKTESGLAGTDSLSPVLPLTQNLLPPFAPSSDQPWLTLGTISNGAIHFSRSANAGTAIRTANITVLGRSIAIAQAGPPPVLINVPPATTIEQTSPAGAQTAIPAPSATDFAGHALAVTTNAPAVFPPGPTMVTFSATDAFGQSASANTTVTVVDTTPPLIANVPAPITVEQSNRNGTPVSVALPTATDAGDPNPILASDAPATFPLGTTTVHFTATDASGNAATATTTVTVKDTTQPVLANVPPAVTVEQSNRNGTPLTLALPTATDICDANPVISSDAPASFPLGVTTVHFTATDASGNVATASTTVTVKDTTPPVLSNVPAPMTVEQNARNGTALVLTPPTATDICDANPAVSSDAPAVFPLGTTTVHFTATDASGNSATASTTVTVKDTTPPALSNVPAAVTVEQTNRDGTPVALALPLAADICDAAPHVSSDAPAVFPLGATLVTFTATDASGNVSHATTTVTVKDTTPPSFANVPAPVRVEQAFHNGTPVSLQPPTAADICDAAPVVSSDEPAVFPLGITTVTYTARDASGNTARTTTTVTVVDTTPPLFSDVPPPIVAEQTNRNGTPVTVPLPNSSDVCDAHVTTTSDAPAVFPLGKTTVTFTAVDASGNVTHAATAVTIVDTTPPVISNVPAPLTVKETSPNGTPVTLSMPTAVDICDAAPKIASNAPALFPKGATVVTFTATDASGNTSQATTTVTVTAADSPPPPPPPSAPVFTKIPDPITVEQTNRNGTPVKVPLAVAPGCTVTSNAPAVFPLGKTKVTFTAVNKAGVTATAKTTVTVRDTIPPTISAISATPNVIVPGDKKKVEVHVSVTASDICDAAPVSRIISVTEKNKQDDKKGRHFWKLWSSDWKIAGNLTLLFKAAGNHDSQDRVYTITVACIDASGNVSKKTVDVTVPRSKKDNKGKDGKK